MQKDNFPFKAVPQSHWPLASTAHKCVLCGKSFGLFQVAENCRGCGRVCCSNCLADHLVLPGQPGTAPVPVCPICAKSITRTHEEAEMAMQRCQLLEEILNEQALQAEKMRSDLREQQEENKLLHHEKERLKATIARMEIEAEVAASKAAAAAAAAASASASMPAASSTLPVSPAASPAKPDSETSGLTEGFATEENLAAMEEKLNKKKRQLDMREATLKDALKKVSADAAKNADQRAALQEQERQVTALVTAKFTALFEEERQRMEDLCTEAVTDVQHQYAAWVAQQQDGVMEKRRRYEQLVEERQQRMSAELAEVRGSRDALQRQLESQTQLIESLQAEARNSAAAARTSDESKATMEALQHQLEATEAAKHEIEAAAAAAELRAAKAEEDLKRVQGELDAAAALYKEETQTRETAFAAYESEQRKAQQRLEAFMEGIRAQQSAENGDREAAVAAAVTAAQEKAQTELSHALKEQQEQLQAQAAADLQAAVQRAHAQHAVTVEEMAAKHTAEVEKLELTVATLQQQVKEAAAAQQQIPPQQQSEQQSEQEAVVPSATSSLATAAAGEAAAKLAELESAHQQERREWAVKEAQLQSQLNDAVRQWEKAVEDGASAMAAASAKNAAALAALTAAHAEEKTELEKQSKELVKRAQSQQAASVQAQDKTLKEEKAALQKTCKELEARLETRKTATWQLQQQLRDCKQQLAEAQAQQQKKSTEDETAVVAQSRAATALQRGAASLVKELQQAQQRIVADHAAAVTQLRNSLQEAVKSAAAASSQKEKKAREAAKQFQSSAASLKQEKEEAQQLLKAEQEKRMSAEAKVEKVKAALQRLQSADQQQRQALAELREQHEAVSQELEAVKAEYAAAQATLKAEALSTASESLHLTGAAAQHLLHAQQRWMQQQTHTEGLYAMTLLSVLQHEWSGALSSTVDSLAREAERLRELRTRNAKALENTTSTIKEVQEDLRVRTQALTERQAAVAAQERRIAEKKRRMDAVCRDLYAVAQELRKKHHDGDSTANVEEVVRSARTMGDDVCSV